MTDITTLVVDGFFSGIGSAVAVYLVMEHGVKRVRRLGEEKKKRGGRRR